MRFGEVDAKLGTPPSARPDAEEYYADADQPDHAGDDPRDAVVVAGPLRFRLIPADKHEWAVRGTEYEGRVHREGDESGEYSVDAVVGSHLRFEGGNKGAGDLVGYREVLS